MVGPVRRGEFGMDEGPRGGVVVVSPLLELRAWMGCCGGQEETAMRYDGEAM